MQPKPIALKILDVVSIIVLAYPPTWRSSLPPPNW